MRLRRRAGVRDLARVLGERLQHYFETYKLVADRPTSARIERIDGRAHAERVVRAAIRDYADAFGGAV